MDVKPIPELAAALGAVALFNVLNAIREKKRTVLN